MTVSKPAAIFYDWDGTLSDSATLIRSIHNQVRRDFGLPDFTPEEAAIEFVRAASESYPVYFGDRWREAYDHLYTLYEREHLKVIALFPETPAILSGVHKLGIKQGIVSNKRGRYLQREIDHFGLRGIVGDCVVGAGDAPHAKPAPDLLHVARAKCDLADNAVIYYVGDAPTDMMAARAAGMVGVFLGTADKAQGAELIFANLQDFLDHLPHLA